MATATGEVAIALAADSSSGGQQQQTAADTVLLDITQLYELPRIHTHKIYHYPQQLLFTYRVTNRCLRTSQPQQPPATIAVTAAAARQCSVSKYIQSLNSLFNT